MKKLLCFAFFAMVSVVGFAAPKLAGVTIEKVCLEEGSYPLKGQYVVAVRTSIHFKNKTKSPGISFMRYEFADKESGKVIFSEIVEHNKYGQLGEKSTVCWYDEQFPIVDSLTKDYDLECRAYAIRDDKEIGRSEPYSFHCKAHVADPGNVEVLYGPDHLGIVFKNFTSRDETDLRYKVEVYYDDKTPARLKDEIEHGTIYSTGDENYPVLTIPKFYQKGKEYEMYTEQKFYYKPVITDKFGHRMWEGELSEVFFKNSGMTHSEPKIRISGDDLVIATDKVYAHDYYMGKSRRVYMYSYLWENSLKDVLYADVNGERRSLYGSSKYFATTQSYSDSFWYAGEVEVKLSLDRLFALGLDSLSCQLRLAMGTDSSNGPYSFSDRYMPLTLNLGELKAEREREKELAAAATVKPMQQTQTQTKQSKSNNKEAEELFSQLEKEAEKISSICDMLKKQTTSEELMNHWGFYELLGEDVNAFEFNMFNPVFMREQAYKSLQSIGEKFKALRNKGNVPSDLVNKFNSISQRAVREYEDSVLREMSILKKLIK